MSKVSKSAVTLSNITFSYAKDSSPLFNNFSLEIESNSVTALMGKSGCGKTTLLRLIAGLENPSSGSIIFADNESAEKTKGQLSYVFQEHRLLPWLTLEQNIRLPLEHCLIDSEIAERTEYYLNKTGLYERKNALPTQASGGECQRAALARAFAFPSNVLLMDEPFQALDAHLKNQLHDLFNDLLSEQSKTVILVTHDENEAKKLAKTIVHI